MYGPETTMATEHTPGITTMNMPRCRAHAQMSTRRRMCGGGEANGLTALGSSVEASQMRGITGCSSSCCGPSLRAWTTVSMLHCKGARNAMYTPVNNGAHGGWYHPPLAPPHANLWRDETSNSSLLGHVQGLTGRTRATTGASKVNQSFE